MLLGGPLFGRFGDLFGARSALVVAFSSSFLTYAVLAVANSINALFLSRVCGFMMHAMHGELASFFRNIPSPSLKYYLALSFKDEWRITHCTRCILIEQISRSEMTVDNLR